MVYLGDLQEAIRKMTVMPDVWKSGMTLGPDVSKLLRASTMIDFSEASKNFQTLASLEPNISEILKGSYEPLIGSVSAASFGPSFDTMFADYKAGFVFNTLPSFDFSSIFVPPDFDHLLDQFRERIERGENGREVLQDLNEPWLTALFDATEFADLVNSSSEEQRAAIDETAQSLLVDAEFVGEVRGYVEALPLTQPRWRIIDRAMDAHIQGNYIYSIPLLLGQLEGMYADLLIVKKLAVRIAGELWELDTTTGQIRNNRKGKPLSVRGLGRIVEISGFRSSTDLRDFAGYVFEHTCPFRNGALHGAAHDFDTLQNSYRSALLLTVIAREFAYLSEDLEDE